jgi:hypothetical protein
MIKGGSMQSIFRAACFAALIAVCGSQAQSADTSTEKASPWKIAINTNLTLTLNTYSNNWNSGELGAMSWAWQFDGTAQRALSLWLTNVNTLKCQFGQTAQQTKTSAGDKQWQSPKKSSDLIDAEALFRFTVSSVVEPFAGVRAITQFVDSRISDSIVAVNPLVLTESFGGLRQISNTKQITWTARLGGAVRQSIDRNTYIPDSLQPAHTVTTDGGLEFVSLFKAATKDNKVNYTTELKVYEALLSSKAASVKNTPEADYWRYPDVTWEHTLAVNLTKYIMFNFYAQMMYDRETDASIKYRQTLGLGLSYAFTTK